MTDRDLLKLIFLPGFSTADRVTQFSGRGVGMDVVRTNIEKIGGAVDIESQPERGTTVRMKLPLTLAIIPALTVTASGDRYAIPQVSLLELVRLEGEQVYKAIEHIHGTPVYRLRGTLLPLVYLERELQVESTRREGGEVNIVVLQADDRHFGLVVDDIHDTEEIVVKPLQKQLKGIGVFAGATIMGDGKVALILDVFSLAQRAGVVSGAREAHSAKNRAAVAGPPPTGRPSSCVLLEGGGWRSRWHSWRAGGVSSLGRGARGEQEVIQYRGEIMPLIHVSHAPRRTGVNAVRALSVSQGNRPGSRRKIHPGGGALTAGPAVGLVVDRILDIVEETIVTRSKAVAARVLFSAVVRTV